MRIAAHGRSLAVPPGWEARIFRRPGAAPVLHVASFSLRDGDGDFGARATGRMRPDDVFASLIEYRPDSNLHPGKGLFGRKGRPGAPRLHQLSAQQLQVARRGQLGSQQFFTDGGRPCCLYVVIHPAREHPARLLGQLARVLSTFQLEP